MGGVLPASAGMILELPEGFEKSYGAPRIRGDDPTTARSTGMKTGCSPHPRG